jgi:hypothetical protein
MKGRSNVESHQDNDTKMTRLMLVFTTGTCKSQASAGDFCTILWARFTFLLFFTVLSRLSQSQSKALLHGEDAFAFARRIVQIQPME